MVVELHRKNKDLSLQCHSIGTGLNIALKNKDLEKSLQCCSIGTGLYIYDQILVHLKSLLCLQFDSEGPQRMQRISLVLS